MHYVFRFIIGQDYVFRFIFTHTHALCIQVHFVVAISAQGSCLAETSFFLQFWASLGLSQPASQPSSQPASPPALCYIRVTCLIRHFDLLLFMCADSQDLWIAFRFHLSLFYNISVPAIAP